MPNWAEGSLKLRGRSENIASALKEMLLSDTVAEVIRKALDDTISKCSSSTAFDAYVSGAREIMRDMEGEQ